MTQAQFHKRKKQLVGGQVILKECEKCGAKTPDDFAKRCSAAPSHGKKKEGETYEFRTLGR